MKLKNIKKRPAPDRIPNIIDIPLDEIDPSPCDERRGEPVAVEGLTQSIRIARQTTTALVAANKKRGKWLLLDGRRVYEALKELGEATILAEVADPDPARAQMQVVHRHNVMPHSPSAKVRLLVQWRAAYESLYPQATKHGGDRRKQARIEAQLSFRQMAAAEWKTTPSTIDRYLKLASAPAQVLRDLDENALTLNEAGALSNSTCHEHEKLLARKGARRAGARRAADEAVERSHSAERTRLWEMLRSIPVRVCALYPDADGVQVEQVAGAIWLDSLAVILGENVAAVREAA